MSVQQPQIRASSSVYGKTLSLRVRSLTRGGMLLSQSARNLMAPTVACHNKENSHFLPRHEQPQEHEMTQNSKKASKRRLKNAIFASSKRFQSSNTKLTMTDTAEVSESSSATDFTDNEVIMTPLSARIAKPHNSSKVCFCLPEQTEGRQSSLLVDDDIKEQLWYTTEDFRRQRAEDKKLARGTHAGVQFYLEALNRLTQEAPTSRNVNKQRKMTCALTSGLCQGYRGLELYGTQLSHRRERIKKVVQAVTLASKLGLSKNTEGCDNNSGDVIETLATFSRNMTANARDMALQMAKADAMAVAACAMG